MSDNKFILQLKGTQTPKSVFEIKNDKLVAPFTGVPHSTDVVGSIIDDKDSSVVVAKGAQNWKLDGSSLVVASSLSGDGADYTGEFNVSGSGLWINAMYSLPTTIFSAGTKWALKLCGKNLLTTSGQTIGFTLVIKIGNTHITSKTFTVAEGANVFCRQLVIDFSESEQAIIKAQSGDSLTVQLLCSDTNASATIYNGMTVFTALQRRVDADVVASDKKTFDDVVQDIDDINDEIDQIHEDIDDLEEYVDDTFVRLDGSSIMTGPLKMRATSSFQCAIAPFWDGVGFYKLNSDNSVTLIASIEDPDGFVPWVTNTYNIGSSLKKWKNLYLAGTAYIAKINNGYDLLVPAKSGTLATKEEVDLAANSGRMITDQGVWYAKMYAATVAPAAEDGTNYADFSQVDGQGNPIIVTYNRVNGAWVQDQTIVPPAEYDGYVPITSKIWDIAEQAGQQGGRILWNHQSKEFTPYPVIVSFDGQNITNSTFSYGTITNSTFSGTAILSGVSTVIMPEEPTNDQIVNKNYVDEAIAAIPTPTVDIKQSIDAEIVGTLTVADNGDVSGFGNSNYLLFPGDLDMTGVNSFEIGVAFTLKLDESVIYLLSENPVSTLSDKHLTFMTQSTGLRFDINDGSNYQTLEGTTRLLRNTKYYAKLTYDGTNYTLSLSTDGINYTTEATAVAQYIPGKITYEYLIGRASSLIEYLHLSDYYIKKNGILVWQGMDAPGLHQRVAKGHEVIEFQPPTSGNNYTWYRKYADGWIEQGGITTAQTINLPITMADANYHVLLTGTCNASNNNVRIVGFRDRTTSSFFVQVNVVNQNNESSASNNSNKIWEVKGMYAQS